MRNRRGRATLRQGLDREVFQVVHKIFEDEPGGGSDVSAYAAYNWIVKSNSSLKRKPKNILLDSIERVLTAIKEEASENEEQDAGLSGAEFFENEPETVNLMNKHIVGSWYSPTVSGAVSPGEKPKRPESRRQANGEPLKKRRKPVAETAAQTQQFHVRLEDVGGVDSVKRELKDHLVLPLLCPEEYVDRKIPIPRGILLHGPPGCGKTVISRAFAAKLGVPFIEILGPSVVSGMSGESEKQIREHFEEARRLAPSLIFIDEIDVIAPKRDSAHSQMEKRIVAQLLISMDSLAMETNDGKPVIVLAATNRPDSLDPALRRGGRFDTEINMGVPNESMRELILKAQTRETKIAPDVDFARLAKMTPGFVGADLRDLVGKAGTWSMDRFRDALEKQAADIEPDMDVDELGTDATQSTMDLSISRLIKRARDKDLERPKGYEDTSITMEAFLSVLPGIQPSSKREGFATIPDTTWADIGALVDVREELQTAIVEPIKCPEKYERVGISAPTGILLWGPPGCGKTLLAKAVASESKANFISVKGPELLNKVGVILV